MLFLKLLFCFGTAKASKAASCCTVLFLNAFLLLCLFTRGSEVKAAPSSGMWFHCIVEVRPVFPNRKPGPVQRESLKLGLTYEGRAMSKCGECASVFPHSRDECLRVQRDWRVETDRGRCRWNVLVSICGHFFAYKLFQFQENVFFRAPRSNSFNATDIHTKSHLCGTFG